MKKLLLALLLVPALALSTESVTQGTKPWLVDGSAKVTGSTTEVLVLTTSTAVPTTPLAGRRGIEIQNLGPNTIYCALNIAAVLNKSRAIAASGGVWAIDLGPGVVVNCIAATANQATGAATIATEVR